MLPRPEARHPKVFVPLLLSILILFRCLLHDFESVSLFMGLQKTPRLFGSTAFPQIEREMSNKKGDELMKQVRCGCVE